VQFGPRRGLRLKPLTDGFDTDGEHVIRVADRTGLNRLPDRDRLPFAYGRLPKEWTRTSMVAADE
jgi:hypothetical protein